MKIGDAVDRQAFLYMRHGVSDWNEMRLCIGAIDRPLTDAGRQQAREARNVVSRLGITEVFHSPLDRAAETARLACIDLGVPMIAEPLLREACLGEKQGCYEADPADDFTTAWYGGERFAGAETFSEVKMRAEDALCLILTSTSGLPMLIAHSAMFRAICDVLGLPPLHLDHCRPWHFQLEKGSWSAHAI